MSATSYHAVEASPTTRNDSAEVQSTLTLAFSADPIVRWLFPQSHVYVEAFPHLIEALGGLALDRSTGCLLAGGVALWLAEDLAPDEERLGETIENFASAERGRLMFDLMGQLEAYHPDEPHWYLPLIGVDPSYQGLGLGSVMLRHGLERCAAGAGIAYLDATSRESARLYERHGFQVQGEVRAGDSPPVFPMVWRLSDSSI